MEPGPKISIVARRPGESPIVSDRWMALDRRVRDDGIVCNYADVL
jgi:hypothetical protein